MKPGIGSFPGALLVFFKANGSPDIRERVIVRIGG